MGKKKRRPKKQNISAENQAAAIAEEEIAPLTEEDIAPPAEEAITPPIEEEVAPPTEEAVGEEKVDEEDNSTDPFFITEGQNFEERAINRRRSRLVEMREEASMARKDWIRGHHMTLIVIASVLVITLIFIGIKVYNDANNPLSRFISASGKNLGSSFHFHITAEENDETLMTYDGVMKTQPSRQRVEIEYKADYTDYSYRNVIYTYNGETDKCNYYNGQWTLSNVTDKVSDFFDFYTDYRVGRFDGGSVLRFTELTSDYASYALTDFVNSLRGRFATDSPAAKITVKRSDDGSADYRYDVSLITVAEIIRDEGASAFFRSTDYDSYVAKLEANRGSIENTTCVIRYSITPSGYLSYLEIELNGAGNSYILRCEMSDFGTAMPDIPDDFYVFADVEPED